MVGYPLLPTYKVRGGTSVAVCGLWLCVACFWACCVWPASGPAVCGLLLGLLDVACFWACCVWPPSGPAVCGLFVEWTPTSPLTWTCTCLALHCLQLYFANEESCTWRWYRQVPGKVVPLSAQPPMATAHSMTR